MFGSVSKESDGTYAVFSKREYRALLLLVAFVTPALWVTYSVSDRGDTGASTVSSVLFICQSAAFIIWGIRIALSVTSPVRVMMMALNVANQIVLSFSQLYYSIGTPKHFGAHLSHVDAIYFTMTTLTTTGFGDITPKSQAARAFVTAEMIASVGFAVVFLPLVVGALARRTSGDARQ